MIKKYLKLFISPIFYINIFNEVINFFLNNLNKINLEKNFFKRHAFINSAISKYKNCNYLEIGVNKNDLFDSIPLKLKNKFGVDPVRGGNYKLTSDLFFKIYSQIKFDVIFIDGMHDYLQCQKDTINSINSLNKNGIIFIHDMLPKNFFEEHVPKIHYKWTGDIWKVGVELLNSKNLEFKIINIDFGIGILKIKDNFEYKKMPELLKCGYKDFLKYYKKFELITSEEALDYINL